MLTLTQAKEQLAKAAKKQKDGTKPVDAVLWMSNGLEVEVLQ